MADSAIQIDGCTGEELRDALQLVLQPLPADHRGPLVDSLARLRDEPLGAFDALVVARQHGQVQAAAWAQPQPGKTASLWLPQATAKLGDQCDLPLIHAAMHRCDAAAIELTQVLLEQDDATVHRKLTASGFLRLAELEYLGWSPEGRAPARGKADLHVTFETYDPALRDQLGALVQETYVDTLDCPELDGMRKMGDVLAGYEQTGDHDPSLWFVMRSGDQRVGVLLLTEHRASRQLELVYMGVAPEARGEGFGQLAIEETKRIADQRDAQRVVLAVDARNTPAQKVYRQAGFTRWASRIVYARQRNAKSLAS